MVLPVYICQKIQLQEKIVLHITIKSNDTICLAKGIVTEFANLKTENWTKTNSRWF